MTPVTKCSLWFCQDEVYARRLCLRHYRSAERNGGTVKLHSDARALYSYAMRCHVIFTRIAEKCWQGNGDGRWCRYCGVNYPEHAGDCIVHTAASLLPGGRIDSVATTQQEVD